LEGVVTQTEASNQRGPRTGWFIVATAAYCLLIALSSWSLGFFDASDPLREPLDPHEWGDVLAGVFSPLAFLWLVYASLSQRAELELQRGELSLNNESQRDQFEAMTVQADAMKEQVGLMQKQVERESERLAKEARELRVWRELYLQGIARYHDALINHTAYLMRDVKRTLPAHPSRAQEFFSLDNFRGTDFVEAGVPRFHYFDEETQTGLIALMGHMGKARIAENNYIMRARTNQQIEERDLEGMSRVLNQLASEAHNLASAGLRRLREEDAMRSMD
jgi:hypothetical protein